MRRIVNIFEAVLIVVLCFCLASCANFERPSADGTSSAETTLSPNAPDETSIEETSTSIEETTLDESSAESTTSTEPEPDFSNPPDPDGTKRY